MEAINFGEQGNDSQKTKAHFLYKESTETNPRQGMEERRIWRYIPLLLSTPLFD